MDIATLGIAIDSTAVRRAATDLDALASAAVRADTSGQRASQGFSGFGASIARVIQQMEQLNAAQARQEALMQASAASTGSAANALQAQTAAAQASAVAMQAQTATMRASAQAQAQAAVDATRLSSSLGAVAGAGIGAGNSISSIGRAGLIFGAVNASAATLVQTLRGLPASGINFMVNMEKAQIGIAGVLASVTAIDGKATTFTQGMEIAGGVARRLQKEAMVTAGTTSELISTYQTLLGPGLAAGMKPAEVEKFTSVGVTAVKALGLASNQLTQELKDLVQGGITQSSSQLAGVMGLKDADIARAKASAEGLFAFLMRRLQGMVDAGPAYAKSFQGTMDMLQERVTMSSAMLFAPLTDAIKEQANSVGEALSNDKNISAMSGMAESIASVVTGLGMATRFAIEHSDAIMTVVTAYAAIKFGGLVAGWASSAQAMVAASAASRLKAAQTAVEALSNEALVLSEREKLAAYLFGLEAQQAYTQGLVSNTAAKVASLSASAAAIEIARTETVSKIESTRTTIAQAEAQLTAARAAGAQSAAIALVAEATVALSTAQAGSAVLSAELAALGRQQAMVHAATAAAVTAQAAATESAALASGQLAAAQRAASASTSAMGSVIGALGGPVGIAIAAVGLLIAKLMSLRSEGQAAALDAQSLERVKAATAAGKAPEARDLNKIPAQVEGLKSQADQLELDIKNNDPWAINGKQEQDRLARYQSELTKVRQRVTELASISSAAEAVSKKAEAGLQIGALGATKSLDALLSKQKTASAAKEEAKTELNALDQQLKAVKENKTTTPTQAVDYEKRVAEAKRAVAVKLRDDLEKIDKKENKVAHGSDTRGKDQTDALLIEKTGFDRQKELYDTRIEALDTYHKKLGMSDEDYAAGRKTSQDAYVAAEQAFYDRQVSIAKGYAAKTPAEVSANKIKLDTLARDHEKFRATMAHAGGTGGLAVLVEDQKRYDDYAKAITSAGASEIKSLDTSIAKQREHNAEIGKTKEQVELARAAKEEAATASLQVEDDAIRALLTQVDLVGVLTGKDRELYQQRLNSLDLIIGKRKEDAALLRQGAELEKQAAATAEQQKMLTDIDNSAKSVFVNVAENGINSFKKIGQSLKTNLWDMLWEMTAKKWIFNVGASAMGVAGSTAAQAATGGVGGGMGSLSNLIGGANPFTDFGGSATNALYSLGSAATNSGFTGLGNVITTNATAMGKFASVAGDALGYVSAINNLSKGNYGSALGAAAGVFLNLGPLGSMVGEKLGSLVDGLFKKGNPTSSTGDSNIHFNAGGIETSRLDMSTVTAFKAVASTGADDIVRGVQAQYAAAAKALGATVADSAFAYSGNTGKGGKESQFALRGGVGGSYYGGGDVAATPEALKLETSRVILTALQGSELPKYLSGMFDGLSAASLNQSQIDQIMSAATAYKAFHAQLDAMPFENLKDLSYSTAASLIAAAGGMDALNTNLGAYYSSFYSAEEKRGQTIKNINLATEGSGLDAATATAENFRALVEAQDVTTESGRKTYTQLLSVSSAFYSLGDNLRKLQDETTTLGIAMLHAVRDNAGADSAQYRLDTKGMSEAERAVFDYNASIKAQTKALTERFDLEDKLRAAQEASMRRNGDVSGADAMQLDILSRSRAIERDKLDESNRAIYDRIAALEDEKSAGLKIRQSAKDNIDLAMADLDKAKKSTSDALAAVEKFTAAEKTRVTVIRDAADKSVKTITGIFDLLKGQTTELYNSVSSTATLAAVRGSDFIDNALNNAQKTGYLPDQKQLAEAISAARGGLSSTQYATQFEADQAALITAGKLSQLQEISGTQLTAAEKTLKTAEDQLKALDTALEYQKAQVDALNGVNVGILSIADAVNALAGAMAAQKAAQAAVGAAQAQGAASLYASNPDAVKAPGKTGLDFWQGQIAANGYDATATKFDSAVGSITGDIKDWYSANPNAVKNPAAADVNYWAGEVDYMGQAAAKDKFDRTVAAMTGTALPSYAVGANYIPHDQIAQLHEGEAVVPKAYNPAAGGIGSGDTARLESLVEALTAEVMRLQGLVAEGNDYGRRTSTAVNGNPDAPILVQTV